MMPIPNLDEYGVHVNGQETYDAIAAALRAHSSLAISWTDQEGTQLDLLLAVPEHVVGPFQGGIRQGDLFVAIMRMGAFAFDITSNPRTDPGYYAEKLGRSQLGRSVTSVKLSDLINGVRSSLAVEEEE